MFRLERHGEPEPAVRLRPGRSSAAARIRRGGRGGGGRRRQSRRRCRRRRSDRSPVPRRTDRRRTRGPNGDSRRQYAVRVPGTVGSRRRVDGAPERVAGGANPSTLDRPLVQCTARACHRLPRCPAALTARRPSRRLHLGAPTHGKVDPTLRRAIQGNRRRQCGGGRSGRRRVTHRDRCEETRSRHAETPTTACAAVGVPGPKRTNRPCPPARGDDGVQFADPPTVARGFTGVDLGGRSEQLGHRSALRAPALPPVPVSRPPVAPRRAVSGGSPDGTALDLAAFGPVPGSRSGSLRSGCSRVSGVRRFSTYTLSGR